MSVHFEGPRLCEDENTFRHPGYWTEHGSGHGLDHFPSTPGFQCNHLGILFCDVYTLHEHLRVLLTTPIPQASQTLDFLSLFSMKEINWSCFPKCPWTKPYCSFTPNQIGFGRRVVAYGHRVVLQESPQEKWICPTQTEFSCRFS